MPDELKDTPPGEGIRNAITDERLEQARLMYRTGYFAGRADRLLGGEYFGAQVRALGPRITPEHLAAWQAEAAAMGVPDPEQLPPGLLVVAN